MAVFSKFAVSVVAVAVGYEEEHCETASALQMIGVQNFASEMQNFFSPMGSTTKFSAHDEVMEEVNEAMKLDKRVLAAKTGETGEQSKTGYSNAIGFAKLPDYFTGDSKIVLCSELEQLEKEKEKEAFNQELQEALEKALPKGSDKDVREKVLAVFRGVGAEKFKEMCNELNNEFKETIEKDGFLQAYDMAIKGTTPGESGATKIGGAPLKDVLNMLACTVSPCVLGVVLGLLYRWCTNRQGPIQCCPNGCLPLTCGCSKLLNCCSRKREAAAESELTETQPVEGSNVDRN